MSNEITTFDLGKPAQAIEVAAILQRFVKEKKLTANIKGKDYPMVEAWAFAGSQLGLYPVLQFVQDQSDANQIKYLAEVNVFRYSDNMMVGKGIAVCSNKEANKRQWDEYYHSQVGHDTIRRTILYSKLGTSLGSFIFH